MFEIILQLHGGGGSSSNGKSEWVPNKYQSDVLGQMTPQYQNYMNTGTTLLGSADNLYNGMATQQVDYNGLYNQSVGNVNNAMNGFNNLAQGNVAGFTNNETAALQSTLNNTMGTNLNNWAKNGVINSSIATSGLNSIANQAASTAASDYNNAISNASNQYGNIMNGAATNLTNASTAQNAAQVAASNLLTDSLSAYNAASGILGTGGSTVTNSSSGGSGQWLSTLASVGGAIAACFVAGTKIKTVDGDKSIENIKVGDKVISYVNGEDVVQTVTEVAEPVKQETVEIVTEDDAGEKHFVETTMSQPLLDEYGTYQMVVTMPVGTKLMNVGKVIAIMLLSNEYVYDFKTDGNNSYYANGFIALGRFE